MGSMHVLQRSFLALSLAILTWLAPGPAVAAGDAPLDLPSASGTLSTVTLVDVSRVPEEVLHTVLPGAEDGLVFLFLVVKHAGVSGAPAVSRLRELRVNQASYQQASAAALGTELAPLVFVEDVNRFLARMSPQPGSKPAVPEGEAWVVVTTVGGTRLPTNGHGEVEIEVGWDGKTEKAPFSFAVPPLAPEGSPEIPARPGEPVLPGPLDRGVET